MFLISRKTRSERVRPRSAQRRILGSILHGEDLLGSSVLHLVSPSTRTQLP